MEKLVELIVKKLVDKPDEVKVESKNEGSSVVITVYASDDDIGKIIGKNGKIAQSLRVILRTVGARSGKKFVLKIENN